MIYLTTYMKKIDKKNCLHTKLALKNFHIHNSEYRGRRRERHKHMIFFDTLLTDERGMKYKCQCG